LSRAAQEGKPAHDVKDREQETTHVSESATQLFKVSTTNTPNPHFISPFTSLACLLYTVYFSSLQFNVFYLQRTWQHTLFVTFRTETCI